MNIGENIIKLRKDKKLTQEELANLVYVSPKTISSWEKNRNLPNIETLILLADIFDTDINTILCLKPETSKEIQKAYKKKSLKNTILIILGLILTLIFFIGVQRSGISMVLGFYYYNNEVLTIDNILEAEKFMYGYDIYYIIFVTICSLYYLFYKKKWKLPIIIISSLSLILCIDGIITSLINSYYPDLLTYFIYHSDYLIFFIISIIGMIYGIKLLIQNKRTKK